MQLELARLAECYLEIYTIEIVSVLLLNSMHLTNQGNDKEVEDAHSHPFISLQRVIVDRMEHNNSSYNLDWCSCTIGEKLILFLFKWSCLGYQS